MKEKCMCPLNVKIHLNSIFTHPRILEKTILEKIKFTSIAKSSNYLTVWTGKRIQTVDPEAPYG